jgi:hypothetical protein
VKSQDADQVGVAGDDGGFLGRPAPDRAVTARRTRRSPPARLGPKDAAISELTVLDELRVAGLPRFSAAGGLPEELWTCPGVGWLSRQEWVTQLRIAGSRRWGITLTLLLGAPYGRARPDAERQPGPRQKQVSLTPGNPMIKIRYIGGRKPTLQFIIIR